MTPEDGTFDTLAVQAVLRATAAFDEQKVRALGRAFRAGVVDEAKVDESIFAVAALGMMERPHIDLLLVFVAALSTQLPAPPNGHRATAGNRRITGAAAGAMQLATYAMIANLAYGNAETGNTDVTMALYRPPGQGASARQRELRPQRSGPGDVSALVLAIAGACAGNPA